MVGRLILLHLSTTAHHSTTTIVNIKISKCQICSIVTELCCINLVYPVGGLQRGIQSPSYNINDFSCRCVIISMPDIQAKHVAKCGFSLYVFTIRQQLNSRGFKNIVTLLTLSIARRQCNFFY